MPSLDFLEKFVWSSIVIPQDFYVLKEFLTRDHEFETLQVA